MIYSASLNIIVKKCFQKQAQQSNIKKICENMPMDPEVTTMDVVILGPKDVTSPMKAEELNRAIAHKHPDVCVIYLYEKDADSDVINADYSKQLRKIKDTGVREAFEEFVGDHKLKQGKNKVSSADFEVPDSDAIGDVEAEKKKEEARLEKSKSSKTDKSNDIDNIDDEETVTITANSIEELMNKISDYTFAERSDSVQTDIEKMVGQHVDFRG